MKKGWMIALIVTGSILSICGILFLVNVFTGNRILRSYSDISYQGRFWNDPDESWFGMHGMRGWNRSSSDEDFYLGRWAAMLGISEEELQTRLAAGESLESIAESLGIEMPCWELDDDDADLSTAPTSYDGWGYGAGMCF